MRQPKNPDNGILKLVLALLVSMVFCGLGFLLLFTELFFDNLSQGQRLLFGGLLLAGAVLRGGMAWRKFRREQEEARQEWEDHWNEQNNR